MLLLRFFTENKQRGGVEQLRGKEAGAWQNTQYCLHDPTTSSHMPYVMIYIPTWWCNFSILKALLNEWVINIWILSKSHLSSLCGKTSDRVCWGHYSELTDHARFVFKTLLYPRVDNCVYLISHEPLIYIYNWLLFGDILI